jgi:hypothetical protein
MRSFLDCFYREYGERKPITFAPVPAVILPGRYAQQQECGDA